MLNNSLPEFVLIMATWFTEGLVPKACTRGHINGPIDLEDKDYPLAIQDLCY